ncbi:hypothetical protein FEN17_06435 [Dyadobacter luticola]|uniref:Uncharacterized protein n=2 Tax=Dyadobacter luticola TaxID=1979387 RepID=A0A5R9L6N6_9BACT|nr:hypothetical protein FEN17_06435 [Dyadobacter luticola]
MDQQKLTDIYTFLEETERTNEDTEYDPSQEPLVNAIIELVNKNGNTSIAEDFGQPFVHPMITIQKWVTELKDIVRDEMDGNLH